VHVFLGLSSFVYIVATEAGGLSRFPSLVVWIVAAVGFIQWDYRRWQRTRHASSSSTARVRALSGDRTLAPGDRRTNRYVQ